MTTEQHPAPFMIVIFFSGHAFAQTTRDSAPKGSAARVFGTRDGVNGLS